MQRIQHDPHVKHDAYGQYGSEKDCLDTERHGWDYVYVYSERGCGGRVAWVLDGVRLGERGTVREQDDPGDAVRECA